MKIVISVMVVMLYGCGQPMDYDAVKADEKYCLDRGLNPIRQTNGVTKQPIQIWCSDTDGTFYSIPEKQK